MHAMSRSSIPSTGSLTIEFKSDRKRLPDDDLVEALVCLANTEGGELWLGVDDDGTPTLPGLVAARTSPSLSVSAEAVKRAPAKKTARRKA